LRIWRHRPDLALAGEAREEPRRLGLEHDCHGPVFRVGVHVPVHAVIVHGHTAALGPIVAHAIVLFVAVTLKNIEEGLVLVTVPGCAPAGAQVLEMDVQALGAERFVFRRDDVPLAIVAKLRAKYPRHLGQPFPPFLRERVALALYRSYEDTLPREV